MLKLNKEKFLNEINSKWINKNCPMCSYNQWNIDSNLVSVMKISENGGIALGGQIMPLVAVTCLNCGNVIFVNPLVNNCVDGNNEE